VRVDLPEQAFAWYEVKTFAKGGALAHRNMPIRCEIVSQIVRFLKAMLILTAGFGGEMGTAAHALVDDLTR
jgi:hypothetical protein